MPSFPAWGTQWSFGAQEGLVPVVHEPTSWEVGCTGATDPNAIVAREMIQALDGGGWWWRGRGGYFEHGSRSEGEEE